MDPHTPDQSQPQHNPGTGAPLVASMTMDHAPRRTRRGNPIVAPDPGTPTSRMLAWMAVLIFAGLTIAWQNLPEDTQRSLIGAPPIQAPLQAHNKPAPSAGADLMVRVYLQLQGIMAGDPRNADAALNQAEAFSGTHADQVRLAILAAEYTDPQAGIDRLHTLELDLLTNDQARSETAGEADTPSEDIAQTDREQVSIDLVLDDSRIVRDLYTDGPDSLTDADRAQLIGRYGTIGEYALSYGRSKAEREVIIGSPLPLMLVGLLILGLVGFSLLIGLGLLIYGLVWYARPTRRMRCEKPTPGGSVMLETYAVFVAGFACLAIGLTAAEVHAPDDLKPIIQAIALPSHWLLMLTVLWPVVRGMPFGQWRRAMGLTRGEGVFREMGFGILVYIATVPLYFVGVGVTFVLITLWELIKQSAGIETDTGTPANPIIDLLGSGDLVTILLVLTLATIWAPITEELIFRGALYRHFRGRVHWFIAAVASAILFAFMHAYGPLMVTPLIVLGASFAFMREWRDSIIAPMTAHFLHNFTLMVIMIVALAAIG